jgi:hypothetical protein
VFMSRRHAYLTAPSPVQGLGLTAAEIATHPALHRYIRQQAQLLLHAYEGNPRLSSVFATQQRWLMGHIALALHFRAAAAGQSGGLTAARFFDDVATHEVASRNTADAFIKEMLQYGYAQPVVGAADKRVRPLEPTQASIDAVHGWMAVHLATLDKLDGDCRVATYLGAPDAIADLQPLVADGLLCSRRIREPERTFSLFTWLDNGGVVMEWLISGIEEHEAGAARVPTGVVSIAALADWLKLSRTHLARKLREAEEMGSIGWEGKRGRSVMWVSDGFRREYARAQAVKLAIIDEAFNARFRSNAGQTAGAAKDSPKNSQRLGGPSN